MEHSASRINHWPLHLPHYASLHAGYKLADGRDAESFFAALPPKPKG
jgi:hypothetical protein